MIKIETVFEFDVGNGEYHQLENWLRDEGFDIRDEKNSSDKTIYEQNSPYRSSGFLRAGKGNVRLHVFEREYSSLIDFLQRHYQPETVQR